MEGSSMVSKSFERAVFLASLAAEILIRAPHHRRRQKIAKAERRVTGTEWAVLGGIWVGMFVLPLVYVSTAWLSFASFRLAPGLKAWSQGLGTAILAAAVWLFWRSHRDLGTNWSPTLEIGAQQKLVTEGVYRRVRHPMYTSQLLWGLGQALLLPNWIAGPAGFATFLILYVARIPQEEQMMLDYFGDEYRAYVARTGRVLPRLAL
jgi:protein-S-isoprenylcysteine O-methyltransferase Ste14